MTHEQSGQVTPSAEQPPADEQQTPVNYYGRVYGAWLRLLGQGTEPLYGDEGARKTNLKETGNRKVLEDGDGITRLALYKTDYRARMAEKIKVSGIELIANPVGHILFERVAEGSEIFGTLYMLESEEILAVIDCTIKNEETLSVGSEGCYDFASAFGLGDAWAKAMFQSQSAETEHNSTTTFLLDNAAMTKLAEHLQSLERSAAG